MAIDDPTPLPGTDMKVFARFMKKVNVTDGCWLWTAGASSTGYGKFGIGGRDSCVNHSAHRLAWTFFVGPIPTGLWVLHACDTPLCCRPGPGHLFLGTAADNNADMAAKGRAATGDRHGARLHPEAMRHGTAHWNSKLTDERVREIRRATGSQREIAALFGVSQMTVSLVLRGKIWKHVR